MTDKPQPPSHPRLHPAEDLPQEIGFDFKPDETKPPRNLTALVMGKLVFVGITMVFLSACVWAVAYILSNLPTR